MTFWAKKETSESLYGNGGSGTMCMQVQRVASASHVQVEIRPSVVGYFPLGTPQVPRLREPYNCRLFAVKMPIADSVYLGA